MALAKRKLSQSNEETPLDNLATRYHPYIAKSVIESSSILCLEILVTIALLPLNVEISSS